MAESTSQVPPTSTFTATNTETTVPTSTPTHTYTVTNTETTVPTSTPSQTHTLTASPTNTEAPTLTDTTSAFDPGILLPQTETPFPTVVEIFATITPISRAYPCEAETIFNSQALLNVVRAGPSSRSSYRDPIEQGPNATLTTRRWSGDPHRTWRTGGATRGERLVDARTLAASGHRRPTTPIAGQPFLEAHRKRFRAPCQVGTRCLRGPRSLQALSR